jgi:hypothetical protein
MYNIPFPTPHKTRRRVQKRNSRGGIQEEGFGFRVLLAIAHCLYIGDEEGGKRNLVGCFFFFLTILPFHPLKMEAPPMARF